MKARIPIETTEPIYLPEEDVEVDLDDMLTEVSARVSDGVLDEYTRPTEKMLAAPITLRAFPAAPPDDAT